MLSVSASPHEIFLSDNVNITINPPDILTVTVNPFWIPSGGSATVTATLMTGGSSSVPVPNAQLVLTTDGFFQPARLRQPAADTAYTNSAGQVITTITASGAGTTAHVTAAYTPVNDCPDSAGRHVQDSYSGHEDPLRDILLH